MVRFLITLVAVSLLAGCTNPRAAESVLSDQGYTNIEITGYKWFACGQDDTYATGFRATSPAGKMVSGCVCQGLFFKNSTIRFE